MNNPGPDRVASGILIPEDITECKQAKEPPEIYFHTIATTEGMDLVEKVLDEK